MLCSYCELLQLPSQMKDFKSLVILSGVKAVKEELDPEMKRRWKLNITLGEWHQMTRHEIEWFWGGVWGFFVFLWVTFWQRFQSVSFFKQCWIWKAVSIRVTSASFRLRLSLFSGIIPCRHQTLPQAAVIKCRNVDHILRITYICFFYSHNSQCSGVLSRLSRSQRRVRSTSATHICRWLSSSTICNMLTLVLTKKTWTLESIFITADFEHR